MKKEMALLVKDWHWVDEVGFPKDNEEDFDWYYTDFGSVEVAGYRPDFKDFYANFGYGGCVVEQENVLAWAKLQDTMLIDKDAFFEQNKSFRNIGQEDLKKYDLLSK